MDTVLTLDHVSKIYHNGRGARNITFSVERGQVVGLLGPNGSGKTTIMKSITGLSQPTEGTITVFGAPVTDREKALMQVGALIEQPALYENLTAQDHLRMAARYYPGVDQARMDKVLEIVGLTPYRKERCGKFSLGMKQRLGLALALMDRPDLLLLDEPINGLDPQGIVEMRELILKLNRERQITVLISSHILDELSKLATHYGFIDGGRMVKEVSAQELEAACRKCARVEVTSVPALCRVLDGWQLEYSVVDGAAADIYGELNITALVDALRQEGCSLLSVKERDESLESYYINLVGGERHG